MGAVEGDKGGGIKPRVSRVDSFYHEMHKTSCLDVKSIHSLSQSSLFVFFVVFFFV